MRLQGQGCGARLRIRSPRASLRSSLASNKACPRRHRSTSRCPRHHSAALQREWPAHLCGQTRGNLITIFTCHHLNSPSHLFNHCLICLCHDAVEKTLTFGNTLCDLTGYQKEALEQLKCNNTSFRHLFRIEAKLNVFLSKVR